MIGNIIFAITSIYIFIPVSEDYSAFLCFHETRIYYVSQMIIFEGDMELCNPTYRDQGDPAC